jgi:hypothetical protein
LKQRDGDLKVIFTLVFSAVIIFMLVMISVVFTDIFLPKKSEQQVFIIAKSFQTVQNHVFELSDKRIFLIGNLNDEACDVAKEYPIICDDSVNLCTCIVSEDKSQVDCYDISANYDFRFVETTTSGILFWKKENENIISCVQISDTGFYNIEFTQNAAENTVDVEIKKIDNN